MSEEPPSKSTAHRDASVDVEQADIPDGDPVEWSSETKRRILEEAAELDLPPEFTEYAGEMARSIDKR